VLPWGHPVIRSIIPCSELEFNEKLRILGKDTILGTPSTFQLIHVFAFLARPLSVLILLDRGVDKNVKTDIGADLLHVACAGGDENLVRILLDRGFDPTRKVKKGRQMSPVMLAARAGHVNVLSVLTTAEVDLEDTDKYGVTALAHAAAMGHLEAVQFLLEKGAQPQARDSQGWSTLHWAASGDRVQVILKLCAYGAEIDATNNDGYTSLFLAVIKGHPGSVSVLMKNGANANFKPRALGGWTPLGAAIAEGKQELVNIMAEFDMDFENAVEPLGRNAVDFAAENGITVPLASWLRHKPTKNNRFKWSSLARNH
jgi:ankyrin repeat protein